MKTIDFKVGVKTVNTKETNFIIEDQYQTSNQK